MNRQTHLLSFLSVVALTVSPVCAQTAKPWHAGNAKTVEEWNRSQNRQFGANTNVWLRPGLMADRSTRKVEILCESTGLESGSIAEFLIVGEKSEKDYEAMAVSFARPSDICQALEFIGLPRGRPIRPSAFEFWPKGERVRVTVRPFGSDPAGAWPIHTCLVDKRLQAALPQTFVYVGSRWTGDVARAACLADGAAPGAILSTYNESTTVLDVPNRAPQGEVYGNLTIAPERRFAGGRLLAFTFTPEPRSNGVPRVAEVSIDVRRRAGATGEGAAIVECVTRGPERLATTNTLAGAVEGLAVLAHADRDPFVSVTFDDTLTVAAARDVATVLQRVEGDNGIRIDAPPTGQLFPRAFLPEERWRARGERPSQPWELRVGRDRDGVWRGMLIEIVEDWSREDSLTPELQVREHPLAKWIDLPTVLQACIDEQVAAVRKNLTQKGQVADEERIAQRVSLRRINTLFVFVPASAPLSAFLPAVRLIRATVPTVYVFCE